MSRFKSAFKFSFLPALLVSGLFGNFAFASGVVSSPFSLQLQSTSLNQFLTSSDTLRALKGEVSIPIPDQTYGDGGGIKLEGISLDLKYAFDKPVASSDFGNWDVELEDASAELVVRHVDASQTIQVQQGGVVLNLTLNATCDEVHLSLPSGSTHAHGKLIFALQDGKPSIQLQDFAADWTPSAWVVSSLKCQGPNGVDQFAATQAESHLRSIDPFFDQIKSQISSQLSALGQNQIAFSFNVAMGSDTSTPISLTLRPRTFTAIPGDEVILDGVADFSFPGMDASKCDTLDPQAENFTFPAPGSTLDQPGDALIFPFSVINRIIQCGYQTPQSKIQLRSSDVPALQSLMHNPFAKMFVWPDLFRFGWNSVLNLELGLTAPATIGAPTRVSQGVIDTNLVLPLLVSVQVPESDRYEHYVDLTANLNGGSRWTFRGDKVTIQEQVDNLKIVPNWDEEFAQEHHTLKLINTRLMNNQFKKFLAEQGIQYKIPALELSQSLQISTTSVDYADGNLRIGIKLDPVTPPSN